MRGLSVFGARSRAMSSSRNACTSWMEERSSSQEFWGQEMLRKRTKASVFPVSPLRVRALAALHPALKTTGYGKIKELRTRELDW